ncbi:tyrosine-type recombinase/integrase [Ferrimonas balearica]|uniref:tyrosine-type recombinase/integrase n=1 Tax=Ferrimonas balearica TaxID=44012 RepID=UPI001C98EA9A|nr:site-specific integrase [Ferrimonas balearica]MBY5920954.1 site-specific integrase [Ferrimonas balearica]MBY5996361.1 site-specific integrase [Ferrimonas balearica]
MALTKTKLDKIVGRPYDGPAELSDRDGLGVRVSPKGVVTFQYRYRFMGRARRLTLGRYPGLTLSEARGKVPGLRRRLEDGEDPGHEHGASAVLDTLLNQWLTVAVDKKLKERTRVLYRSVCKTHLIGRFPMPVEKITMPLWLAHFDSIAEQHSPVTAGSALRVLKTALRWAVRRKLVTSVLPVLELQVGDVGEAPKRGERVLDWNELATIWKELSGRRCSPSSRIVLQFAMLTGCRLSEALQADWSEFTEGGLWVVPKEHSKTNRTIRRPLSSGAKQLLKEMAITYGAEGPVFPGLNLSKPLTISSANKLQRHIRNDLGFPFWRAHDFRRSLSTNLSAMGFAPHVTEKMLGHELPSIMATYNKHDWLEEQEKAYEAYYRRLMEEVSQDAAKVVGLF